MCSAARASCIVVARGPRPTRLPHRIELNRSPILTGTVVVVAMLSFLLFMLLPLPLTAMMMMMVMMLMLMMVLAIARTAQSHIEQ